MRYPIVDMKGTVIFLVTKLAVRLYCWLFVKLRVHGLSNLPHDTSAIVVANHRSKFDGFLVYSLMERMIYSFIKNDYFKNPVVGWYLKGGGGIPVKKGELRVSAIREAKRALATGDILLVFPEGQVNDTETERVLPFEPTFMKLSVQHRVPVIPAVIIGTERALADGKWFPRRSEIFVIFKEPVQFHCPTSRQDDLEYHVEHVRNLIADTLRDILLEAPVSSSHLLG